MMLNQLTKYLLQYRTVTVPHVGSIQIQQHAAQWNVVDEVMQPFSFTAVITAADEVPSHQLTSLSGEGSGKEMMEELNVLGRSIKDKIDNGGFNWAGIGMLLPGNEVKLAIDALPAVPAKRTIREGARHQVLVGDHQVMKDEHVEVTAVDKKPVSLLIKIGWLLLLLSLIFIAYNLYKGKFRVPSTGSKQTVSIVIDIGSFVLEPYNVVT